MGQNISSVIGHQVLYVFPESPAAKCGIQPVFDFVMAVNHSSLRNDGSFYRTIADLMGQRVVLTVWNSHVQAQRGLGAGRFDVVIVPSQWGQSWKKSMGLLGLKVRCALIEAGSSLVWQILRIAPSSPAETAGMTVGDFIVGAHEFLLESSEDLQLLAEQHGGENIVLFVYSESTRTVREVSLVPGTHGVRLGCQVGFGPLHRINSFQDPPISSPVPEQRVLAKSPPTRVDETADVRAPSDFADPNEAFGESPPPFEDDASTLGEAPPPFVKNYE